MDKNGPPNFRERSRKPEKPALKPIYGNKGDQAGSDASVGVEISRSL